MKKGDIFLGIILLIMVAGYFIYQNISRQDTVGANIVEIRIDGEIYDRIPLEEIEEDKVILINNDYGMNELLIDQEGVEMIHADCPDQVCIHTGKIDRQGPMIVCLPHKLSIEIVGQAEDELDAISQ